MHLGIRRIIPHVILIAGLLTTSSVVLYAVYRGLTRQIHDHLAGTGEAVMVLLACAVTVLTVYGSIAYVASRGKSPQDN